MPMTRDDKAAEVALLQEKFANAEILLLTQNLGLDAKATNELRVATRAVDVDYRVAKNTLAKIALKGGAFEKLTEKMKGPTGFVTANDPVAAAKVIADFSKKNPKLQILGAIFGEFVMDGKDVEAFSKLPTLNEIRSKLVGLLQAPASQLVGVTKAYGEKDGSAEDAAPASEPEAAPAE